MGVYLAQRPIYRVVCDVTDCGEEFQAVTAYRQMGEHSTRHAAEKAGWAVRPAAGKGSRSAPDLCPVHAQKAENGALLETQTNRSGRV